MKFVRYVAIASIGISMLACNLNSALTTPQATDTPIPPVATSTILPTENQNASNSDTSGYSSDTTEKLDLCSMVKTAEAEAILAEPVSEAKSTSGGCSYSNAKDGLYALSFGAAQDEETSGILQGQMMLLGFAGVKMDQPFIDKIRPLADAMDFKGFFTEMITASQSSTIVKAKLFSGGGNDLTFWVWITAPPRRQGALVAVRDTTLVNINVVVAESQTEDAMLKASNNLANAIFTRLPAKFTNGTAAATQSQQPAANAVPAQVPAAGQPTPTLVPPVSAAPNLVSPADGTVIEDYPRTLTLTWSPVTGANKYLVEIMACSPNKPADCFSHPMIEQTTRETTSTSYTFNFVGAQPGKWRVSALYDNGVLGTPSTWWTFRFTR